MKKFNLLFLTALFVLAVNTLKAECDFKPKHIIQVDENSEILVAYVIQVMRISTKHPKDINFHPGLRAVYQTCNQDWVIRTQNYYPTMSDAKNNLRSWKDKGYVDAFIIPTYLYLNSSVSEDNQELKPTVKNENKVPQKSLNKPEIKDSVDTIAFTNPKPVQKEVPIISYPKNNNKDANSNKSDTRDKNEPIIMSPGQTNNVIKSWLPVRQS